MKQVLWKVLSRTSRPFVHRRDQRKSVFNSSEEYTSFSPVAVFVKVVFPEFAWATQANSCSHTSSFHTEILSGQRARLIG